MSRPSHGKLAQLTGGRRKTMKCHYREQSLACAFHYNGLCLRDHNYECPGLATKNLSHGEMVQIAEAKKHGFWEYVDDVDYRCSVCHKYAYGCIGEVMSGQYKYCPYCGAEMEVEEDDDNQN